MSACERDGIDWAQLDRLIDKASQRFGWVLHQELHFALVVEAEDFGSDVLTLSMAST